MKHLLSILMICLFATGYAGAQTEIVLDNKMFSGNWFNSIEEAQKNPDKVLYLDLSLQKLRNFPTTIFQFKNLKELHLSYNYWPSIPSGLSDLQHLEILDLSGNYYMKKLPPDIDQLTGLETLKLLDNKLLPGEAMRAQKALLDTEVLVD